MADDRVRGQTENVAHYDDLQDFSTKGVTTGRVQTARPNLHDYYKVSMRPGAIVRTVGAGEIFSNPHLSLRASDYLKKTRRSFFPRTCLSWLGGPR